MSFLDWIIVAILVLAAFWGYRTGLVGMVVAAVGAGVGWVLAGQLSNDVGGIFGSEGGAATVVAYAIIMAVVIAIALAVWRTVRPVVTLATLGLAGMVDRLGGLGVGLLVGLVLSGALIVVLTLVAYNLAGPGGVLPMDGMTERVPQDEDTRNLARRSLEDSAIVGGLIHIIEPIYGAVLDFDTPDVPSPLTKLKQEIQGRIPQGEAGRNYGTSR